MGIYTPLNTTAPGFIPRPAPAQRCCFAGGRSFGMKPLTPSRMKPGRGSADKLLEGSLQISTRWRKEGKKKKAFPPPSPRNYLQNPPTRHRNALDAHSYTCLSATSHVLQHEASAPHGWYPSTTSWFLKPIFILPRSIHMCRWKPWLCGVPCLYTGS